MAHSAGHQLFDLRGWDAQPGGPVGLIFGDQPVGDIIAVVRALFDCVARCHPVAVVVKQNAGEQARLVSACAGVARGGIGGKLLLNRIPQRLIDDPRVFAGVGLALVNDLARLCRRRRSAKLGPPWALLFSASI